MLHYSCLSTFFPFFFAGQINYLLGIVIAIIEHIKLVGMGGGVSSLNNTLKLHSAISFFFEKSNNIVNLFWLPNGLGRIRTLLLRISERICWHIVIAANRSLA